jgi:hypothetical protein
MGYEVVRLDFQRDLAIETLDTECILSKSPSHLSKCPWHLILPLNHIPQEVMGVWWVICMFTIYYDFFATFRDYRPGSLFELQSPIRGPHSSMSEKVVLC